MVKRLLRISRDLEMDEIVKDRVDAATLLAKLGSTEESLSVLQEHMMAERRCDFPEHAKLGQGWVLVGWIQEHKSGRKTFYEGDLDPREVHDNGCPTYRVFKAPGASDD